MSDKKITVLVAEPMKETYTREICGLKEMQALVGGDIEAVPISDREPVVVVVNANGKMLELPYNRPLNDEHGMVRDILCGTFFVTCVDGEEFVSLTDDQLRRYKEKYDNEIVLTAVIPKTNKSSQKGKDHHER